jgi:hypothetical protein
MNRSRQANGRRRRPRRASARRADAAIPSKLALFLASLMAAVGRKGLPETRRRRAAGNVGSGANVLMAPVRQLGALPVWVKVLASCAGVLAAFALIAFVAAPALTARSSARHGVTKLNRPAATVPATLPAAASPAVPAAAAPTPLSDGQPNEYRGRGTSILPTTATKGGTFTFTLTCTGDDLHGLTVDVLAASDNSQLATVASVCDGYAYPRVVTVSGDFYVEVVGTSATWDVRWVREP